MAISEITRTLQLLSCDFCGTVHASLGEARAHGCLSDPPKQKFSLGEKVFVTLHIEGHLPRNVRCRVTSVRSPRAAGWRPEEHLPVGRRSDGTNDHLAIPLTMHAHDWVVTVECEDDPADKEAAFRNDAVVLPAFLQTEVHPLRGAGIPREPLSIRPSLRGPVSIREAEPRSAAVSQSRIISVPPVASVPPAPRAETPTLRCMAP